MVLRTPRSTARPVRAAVVVAVLASTLVASSRTTAAQSEPAYLPPVDAPVVDGFRPPEHAFGPGNRGLEYGTEAGTAVRAAADGRVVFAGDVAGARHVTVLHPDGLRTTYSFLDELAVVVGQSVDQGQVVGTTAGHLHLGARLGDDYLDPASLFGSDSLPVRLVPFELPPGAGLGGERSAISQLVGGVGGALGDLAGAAGDLAGSAADWLRDDGAQLLRTALHYADRLMPVTGHIRLLATALQVHQEARRRAERPCTADGVAVPMPDGGRVAVLVAGLGSNSHGSTVDAIDTEALGYSAADVLRFSYAGGRTPDPTDGFPGLATTTYGPADTQADLWSTGAHLADLLEDLAAAAPGQTVDLYAHSQGGLVVRAALIELEQRHGPAGLASLGLVATLGTPHGGADLATALHANGSTKSGGRVVDATGTVTGMELDPDAPSAGQLSETSEFVAELARHPVPPGVDAVSIAARGDLIVPVPRSVAPGMTEVVVPLTGPDAHSDLPGSAAAHRELSLALAGLPPGCESYGDALLDQATGEVVSYGQDLAGAVGWVGGAWADLRGGRR